jgi:hypothetical protein
MGLSKTLDFLGAELPLLFPKLCMSDGATKAGSETAASDPVGNMGMSLFAELSVRLSALRKELALRFEPQDPNEATLWFD